MKQLMQNLSSGNSYLEDVPKPSISSGTVTIKSVLSLVSRGTEQMLVDFGKASLINKAKQQPEKVKQVINKISTDGLLPTLNSVKSKLDTPIPLGYCNVGTVIEVGENVQDIKVGDRVVSNGNHSEIVNVPYNLVAKIPDEVSFDEAVFTVATSIGLQGLRLSKPTLGETIIVFGLGLIGQLTAQLAKAHGCKVIGIDIDKSKVELANSLGIESIHSNENTNIVSIINSLTNNIGADAILITASTKNNSIISQSAKMARKNGRIILIGVIGLNLNRNDFYEKELTFQVSCSYGPGRYDPNYEQKNLDYPLPYVRWTEKRNFEAVLEAMRAKTINVKSLISEKVKFEDAPKIYENLNTSKSIATIFEYSNNSDLSDNITLHSQALQKSNSDVEIAVVGAGNFTRVTLLPLLYKCDIKIKYLCSKTGISSAHLAKKFNVQNNTTSYKKILDDKNVSGVIITTRHNQHASMVIDALNAHKNVFVEKPLCITQNELDSIIKTYEDVKNECSLTVGFNRRFSPLTKKIKELVGKSNTPISAIITINAGELPSSHWINDLKIGGGRIIGEACHFIDLFSYIAGSPIKSVFADSMQNSQETVSIQLKCENGSIGNINYFSNGSKVFPKEQIDIFTNGKVIKLDNFKLLQGWGFSSFKKKRLSVQDKGHFNELNDWTNILHSGGTPIMSLESIINTTKATFAVVESIATKKSVTI